MNFLHKNLCLRPNFRAMARMEISMEIIVEEYGQALLALFAGALVIDMFIWFLNYVTAL